MAEEALTIEFLETLDYYALQSLSYVSKNLRIKVEEVFRRRLLSEKGTEQPAPQLIGDPHQWMESYDYSRQMLIVSNLIPERLDFKERGEPFGYVQEISKLGSQMSLCLYSNSNLYLSYPSFSSRYPTPPVFKVTSSVSGISGNRFISNGKVYKLEWKENFYYGKVDYTFNLDSERVSEFPIVKIGKNYWVDNKNRIRFEYDIKTLKSDREKFIGPWLSFPEKIEQVAFEFDQLNSELRIALVRTITDVYLLDLQRVKIIKVSNLLTDPRQQTVVSKIIEIAPILSRKKISFWVRTSSKEVFEFRFNGVNSADLIYLPVPFQGKVDKISSQGLLVGHAFYSRSQSDIDRKIHSGFQPDVYRNFYLIPEESFDLFYGSYFLPMARLSEDIQDGIISEETAHFSEHDFFGNQQLGYWNPKIQGRRVFLVYRHPQTGELFPPVTYYHAPDFSTDQPVPGTLISTKIGSITGPDGVIYEYQIQNFEIDQDGKTHIVGSVSWNKVPKDFEM